MLKSAVIFLMLAFMLESSYEQEEECEEITSPCLQLYKNLEELCYNYTSDASDYFSIPDVTQRDGFFGVRESALYITYNGCRDIYFSLAWYRDGVGLEKDKQERIANATGTGTQPSTTTPTTVPNTPISAPISTPTSPVPATPTSPVPATPTSPVPATPSTPVPSTPITPPP